MGKISQPCLTSTPDASTLYGIDITESYDNLPFNYRAGESFVIIKSNTNPTSPEDLTWSVWSRAYLLDLGDVDFSGSYSCAVTNEGVFTFFYRFISPHGFRYDPNGKPDGSDTLTGPNGRGVWTTIKFDPEYNWYGSFTTHMLEYVNTPNGPVLVHVIQNGYQLNFAIYDETTKTLTNAGQWSFLSDQDSIGVTYAIGHGRLYSLTRRGPLNYGTLPNFLYTNTDPDTQTAFEPAETIGPEIADIYNLRAIGGGPGQAGHFLLFSKYNGLYSFALNSVNHATTNLSDITVSDTSGGIGPHALKDKGRPVAETIGSMIALVLLGVAVVKFYNRMNKAKTTQESSQAEAGAVAHTDIDDKASVLTESDSPPAMSMHVGPSLSPAVQSIPPQPPATILPMTPILSTSQHHDIQDQIQGQGFSNHIPPTVANSSTATSAAAPWQPTPFVPPASSHRIRAPELDESTLSTGQVLTASPQPHTPRNSRPNP
ncbi:MAG: hypothetical protein J3R72DRAFT_516795 [Linnemannia gamsii]|nr:MAG: hypothetical protein J3R72DRAFT_516795 [Linnemannia gamsii]